MRPYLVILIFLSSTVLARYHEKTRFDRSIHDEKKVKNTDINNSEKKWSFTDDVTQYVAYKSKKDNDCYLENIKQNQNVLHKKRQTKVLYASTVLTKLEAWKLAGGRIVDFCNGRSFILLQTNKPIPEQTLDPFLNEISNEDEILDENDISSKRVTDVVLTPLISRMKRDIQLEQRETLNKKFGRFRQRRQTNQFRRKFRGQTQSQYLNIGSGEQKEGKAEAESTQQSSHAIVSGSRGMGQAQSMSSGGTGCEDCPGYPEIPDKLQVPSGISYPGGITPGAQITYPGGVVPGGVSTYPGVLPGTRPGTYPGGVQPSIITPGRDGTYPGGVQPGVVSPGGIQPGTVIPSGDRIYPGGVRPGIVTPGGDGTYPGVRPGVVMPSGDGTYPEGVRPGVVTPGGIRPGIMIPGGDGTYPGGVRPGVMTPGGDGTYPGGVRPGIAIPGGDRIYPGGVRPGVVSPGGDGTYPGGVRPGIVIPGGNGIYPGGVRPGVVTPSGDGLYPGVRPGVVTPSGDGKYPPGTLITGGRETYPGGVLPGTTTTGIGTYPGGIQPGVQPGQITYPGGVITSVTTGATIIGAGTYPSGITPGTGRPGGIYPGGTLPIGTGETYPGTGIHPGSVQPETVPGTYPGGVVPGGQRVYPGGVQQTGAPYPGGVTTGIVGGDVTYPIGPGGLAPGMVTTTGSTADAGTQVISYPGGRPTDGQAVYPAPGVIQPGRIPDGIGGTQVVYPGTGTYPGGGQPQIVYPSGTQQVIPPSSTLYPGQQVYPGGRQVTYPGQPYPGTSVGISGTGVPGGTVIPGGTQYPISTTGDQVTTGGTGVAGQYPSGIGSQVVGAPYPGIGGIGTGMGTGGTSQYPQIGVSGPAGVADDNAESQALSSVQQEGSGTQASASAQGRYGQGTAQSQVTGTYSGSSTFSAQAGTSDANKSAQAEISGGKEGATSNAQGVAGYGKSQTQVQLNSDSGATSTGAQSSGWNHGTNSQVQASSKGGMADAQANGEGSTSSQAQIGFQPYLKTDEKLEKRDSPFRGSGTASAQSGTRRGQSQSQLQGSFQYGITYTGAAQAGSGSGAASSRKPFNFNITKSDLFKPFKPQDPLKKPIVDNAQSSPTGPNIDYENRQGDHEQGLQSSSTSKQTVVIDSKNNPENPADKKVLDTEKPPTDDTMYDEYDDDYVDEYYDTTATTKTLTTTTNPVNNGARAFIHQRGKVRTAQRQNHQAQVTQVIKGDKYDVHVTQDSNSPRTGDVLQPGQSLMGYTIPPGFRGRVMSISGTETIAQGDGKSQSQTVSLVPKNSTNIKPSVTETRSLQTNHERHVNRHTSNSRSQTGPSSGQSATSDKRTRPIPTSVVTRPSYYTVTNSVAGKINGSNTQKQYEHRYYTKSSTCGYFTFSCNVVYGSNGRTKICKPKAPTYPDGTPMRC